MAGTDGVVSIWNQMALFLNRYSTVGPAVVGATLAFDHEGIAGHEAPLER